MIRIAALFAIAGVFVSNGQPLGEHLRTGVRIDSGPWLEIWTTGPDEMLPRNISNSLLPAQKGSFYRVFLDSSQKLVFAYELQLEVAGSGDAGTFHVRVNPVGEEFHQNYRDAPWLRGWSGGQPLPTFAAAFDPRPMRVGDQLSIRVLRNPSTGQVVSDNLRLSPPELSRRSLEPPGANQLRLSNLTVLEDGTPIVQGLNGGVVGRYVMFYLPGHGAFVFSRNRPAGDPRFRPAAQVEDATITFTWQGRRYQCVNDGPVSSEPGPAELWIAVEAGYRPQPDSGGGAPAPYLSAADSPRSWLPPTR